LCFEHLDKYLKRGDHILIGEESINDTPFFDGMFNETTYQWILDPIDGTATYSTGTPTWGTIFTLLKHGQPIFGAVALPALDVLYFTRGDVIIRVDGFLSGTAGEIAVKKPPFTFGPNTQISCHGNIVRAVFYESPCLMVDYWGPAETCWIADTKLAGIIKHDSIWDFAAAWAFAPRCGMEFIDIASGNGITALNLDVLSPQWKLHRPALIGHRDIYNAIKPNLKSNG